MPKLSDEAMLKRTRERIKKVRQELKEASALLEDAGYFDLADQTPMFHRVDDIKSYLADIERREALYAKAVAAAVPPGQMPESMRFKLVKVEGDDANAGRKDLPARGNNGDRGPDGRRVKLGSFMKPVTEK